MSYLTRLFPPPEEQRRKQRECDEMRTKLYDLIGRLETAVTRMENTRR